MNINSFVLIGLCMLTASVPRAGAQDEMKGRALVQALRQAVSEPPPSGKNDVFVAHGKLIRAISGAHTGEAGAVVFLPRGNGIFNW